MPGTTFKLVAGTRNGDIEHVARYFAQPDVRAVFDSLNERAQNGTASPHGAWYERFLFLGFSFTTIARGGHVALLEWFLSQASMEPTIRMLLVRIALTIVGSTHTRAREMFEVLLVSPVYTSALTDRDRDAFLAKVLREAVSSGHTRWIEPLLAHGADIMTHFEVVSPAAAATEGGNTQAVECLVANGAFLNPFDLVSRSVWEGDVAEMCAQLRLRVSARDARQ